MEERGTHGSCSGDGRDFRIRQQRTLVEGEDGILLSILEAPLIARHARPGQFVIVRSQDTAEGTPLTIAALDRAAGTITLIHPAAGRSARELAALRTGDAFRNVLGPLGTPIPLRRDAAPAILVGGGSGIATIWPVAQDLHDLGARVVTIIGARTRRRLILEEELGLVSDELITCTDDGSRGRRGSPDAALRDVLDRLAGRASGVIAAGPIPMLDAIVRVSAGRRDREPFDPRTVQDPQRVPLTIFLNPVMVDGTGLCGGCRVRIWSPQAGAWEARFACVDGPAFDGYTVDLRSLAHRTGPALGASPRPPRTPVPARDPAVRIRDFAEVGLGYDLELARNEADRRASCGDPRFRPYCPLDLDLCGMVDALQTGDVHAAYQTIARTHLFPGITGRVCAREDYCEMAAGRPGETSAGGTDAPPGDREDDAEPVGFAHIERFVADWARENGVRPDVTPPPGKGRRIGIVGSGPAGLSAAAELALLGHECTIFEALSRPGGVLVLGIPEFRLPRRVVDHEIDHLRRLGVRIVCNTLVGRTVTLDDLQEQFDAIMIGTGAGHPRFLGIPGEELSGVYSGHEYLARANAGPGRSSPHETHPGRSGRRVAVLGGGIMAIDAARVARRLGAEVVDVIYRRARAELPAQADQIRLAEEEGIGLLCRHDPIAIHGDDDGRVRELELVRVGTAERTSFRRPYDLVVLAAGHGPNPLLASLTSYLVTNEWGQLVVDPGSLLVKLRDSAMHKPAEEAAEIAEEAGLTSAPGPVRVPIICAGGGVIGSQDGAGGSVITAMRHGRIAARTIHRMLSERYPEPAAPRPADR